MAGTNCGSLGDVSIDHRDAVDKLIKLCTNQKKVQENNMDGRQASGTDDLHFCAWATSLLIKQKT